MSSDALSAGADSVNNPTGVSKLRTWSQLSQEEKNLLLKLYENGGSATVIARENKVDIFAFNNAIYAARKSGLIKRQSNKKFAPKKGKTVVKESTPGFSIVVSGINVKLAMPENLKVNNVQLTDKEIILNIT